ncbi:hypothetical protein COCSUDRAFT_60034 [Coccomyxa subellipsoidea C-169]|uniref:Uncharacterized protein n=1 Tax=Coccomyxa subellipsoidea (strain C-169) TaxID=574566 RepID=I0YK08_COCSC|nr:hypothetical protein COCSUDRAFT_60034 [Coccomyxa subellipsoidea C-169]EIE18727.1 hypothetical protein COCSUDRAFT_60034 [Coccomyxa subellipsoidea C-169]|eukprot:XP_005643271.1 hypothetical protein COCSUDRAFT_60034 [Coccomyxa subellipsoidea C-169]
MLGFAQAPSLRPPCHRPRPLPRAPPRRNTGLAKRAFSHRYNMRLTKRHAHRQSFVQQLTARAESSVFTFAPRDIAMSVNALGKLAALRGALSTAFSRRTLSQISNLGPRNIAQTRSLGMLMDYSPQDFATTFRALVHLGVCKEEVAHSFAAVGAIRIVEFQ